MRNAIVVSLLLSLHGGDTAAQTVSDTFANNVVTFEAPAGYHALDRGSPFAAELLLGFRAPPRAGCVSGLLVIVLVDLAATAGGDTLSLEQFAPIMVHPLSTRFSNWVVSETTLDVNGTPTIRYDWTGSDKAPPKCPCERGLIPMRGSMIVGITHGLGFALQSWDDEANAPATLSDGDALSHTFLVQALP